MADEPAPTEPKGFPWLRPLKADAITPELEHVIAHAACMQVYEARVQALARLVEQLAELCGALAEASGIPNAREQISAGVFREVYVSTVRAAEDKALADLERVAPGVAARFQAELGRDLPPV